MPILYCTYCVRVNFYFLSGMHECGKTPAAPASNAWGTLLLARPCCVQLFFIYLLFFFSFHDSCQRARNRVDPCQFGPNRSVSTVATDTHANQSIQAEIEKKKKVWNAPFGRNNNKRCKMHRLDKNNKTLYHLQSPALSLLTSHLQLSLTLVSHLYAPCHGSLPLLSVSPLSHNLTLTLTQSHSHPHRPGDPLSSLKLRYQSQAFNLSFS